MHESTRHRPFWHDDDNLDLSRSGPVLLRASTSELVESLLGLRALQAFDVSPAVFPIRRELRFAARRSVDSLFDQLALQAGTRAHRIDGNSLLMEGEGYVAEIKGHRKIEYTSGTAHVWARSLETVNAVEQRILAVVGDDRVREQLFTIDWHFQRSHGLSSVSFEELADPQLIDAAYPTLIGGVTEFVARYLGARETVLVLQGPPGTGKTRLVRAILAALSHRKGDAAKVLYTADRRALESDEIVIDFLTGEHDAFVVEDADHLLGTRANGNVDLHRFLTVADGVVRAQGRKIIFTTNLHNIGDIDEALVRPGRCFGVIRTRALALDEAKDLLVALTRLTPAQREQVLALAFESNARGRTLAELYHGVEAVTAPERQA
jgi:ATPase family associated with various cellular activities (AAA)